jgi:hypothetical protein
MAADVRPSETALPGFSQLLRKEMIDARRSKRLIVFAIVMTLALLTIVIAVGAEAANETGANDGEIVDACSGRGRGSSGTSARS